MKTYISIFLIFVLNGIIAQKSELGVSYSFGLSTNDIFNPGHNLSASNPTLNRKLVFLNNQSFGINYEIQVSNRYNLWLYSDLGYANTEYYRPIFAKELCLESIRFYQKRLDLSIGVSKKMIFYDSLLEIDLGLLFRNPIFLRKSNVKRADSKPYSSFPDWIHYDYDVEIINGSYFESDENITKFNRFLSPKLIANAGYYLTRKIKLNLGLSFTTNVYLFYDYKYNVTYYSNGTTTIYDEYHFNGTQSSTRKFGAKSNFFSLNVGVSYKF